MHISDGVALAKAMETDGRTALAVERIAQLGGRSGTNQERDLVNWTRNMCGVLPEIYALRLQLETKGDPNTLREVHVPVMPIHRMLQALWRAGPMQFRVSLIGEEGHLGLHGAILGTCENTTMVAIAPRAPRAR